VVSAVDPILAFNAGSSSLKVGLFDAAASQRIGEAGLSWSPGDSDAEANRDAVRRLIEAVGATTVSAVGHRVVHGGTCFPGPVRIDETVRAGIETLSPLAPLHNPAALAVIDAIAAELPGVPQVAAFDTAFHQTLLPDSYLYALPFAWYEEWGVRRFGFHGLSHAFCAQRSVELLGVPADRLRLVVAHLGSGCSLAAITGGYSVATTMGFTPLDGLMMSTRPGSIDPGIMTFLLNQGHLTTEGLEEALQRESGLKGVSGLSGDMRELLAARAAGHLRASLAFDVYVNRLREEIAAMATHLGGLDALIFTAGVGEGAAEVRAAVCTSLDWIGINLDEAANVSAVPDIDIATAHSQVRVLVIHTQEDLLVARQTRDVLFS
jgi:acetate kinase